MTNPETGYEKAHRQVEQIFRQFFPARGMVTREGQIRLCHMMLDALFGLDVALCDAGVGLGKTYAYLVACVLWQLQRPRQMQRPVVISTASVALQSAILTEYIPFLSNILIQNGYIQKPICAVLRKGKERFACDRRLLIRQKQIGIRGERFRRRAAALRAANQCLDLDLLPGISRHDRRLICVPERCSRSCILHSDCRYRQYLKDSNGASVTIQVCNHNYLLADAAHRQNGWKPLLKDYQALVIDEAHKLPETVRQMNTRRIRSSDLLHFERILTTSHCTLGAQKLRGVRMAFLTAFAPAENESEREKLFCLTAEQSAALQHLDKAIQEIFRLENKEVPPVLRNKLSDVHELIPLFLRSDTTFVRYVEYHQENGALAIDLCAVPFDLPQCVYDALWREQKPAIGHFTFHALRHTFATRALERGMDYKTLSAILGHYSVSFTMDTYVHSMDEHKRNEMDKMDDLFGISLEISVEQQPYPVLFTVTEEGCKAFAPDFPKIQIQAGTMETALMEAKKQIQKALSQFKYPPIPTRQEDIVVPENSVLILLKTA